MLTLPTFLLRPNKLCRILISYWVMISGVLNINRKLVDVLQQASGDEALIA